MMLEKWEQLSHEQVPSRIAHYQKADASKRGVGAALCAVLQQPLANTQCLVVAKSRLAKQGLFHV